MAAVWSSDHPEVLAWWADLEKRNKVYAKACRKIEEEYDGRHVMLRTGWGDSSPMGISTKSYREEPPPGWKLGWGKRGSGFFAPRATPTKGHPKEFCDRAQQAIADLNKVYGRPRQEGHEKFGTPTFEFFGLVACSPGYVLLDGVLWLTFGTHDYEPGVPVKGNPLMMDFYIPRKRSEYLAACEASGYNPDND